MKILEQISTAIVAKPIASALITLVVVASVGHVPRISTKTGFSRRMPLRRTERLFCLLIVCTSV